MAKGTPIALNEDERTMLVSWIHAGKTERRLAERARMILALADGHTNQAIAADLHTRPARVSKWRTRVADQGLAGLTDAGRDGRPPRYDVTTERRILAVLDEPPRRARPPGPGPWSPSGWVM